MQQPLGLAVPKQVYVNFMAEISPHTTEALTACLADLVNKGVKEVYLLMSTPGGSVMHGITLHNFLKALPLGLTIHNIGNVDSIGNAIFLAGAKRYACANSTFMFHGVGFDLQNSIRLEEKFLNERLDSIRSDQKRIGSIISERTKLPAAEVERLFYEAQTKDATFAAGCGIIDEIRDVQIPAGSPIISLVFKR
jgi:ATP-dependent Clp protease protease subunit